MSGSGCGKNGADRYVTFTIRVAFDERALVL
jgi:hypothetical protein